MSSRKKQQQKNVPAKVYVIRSPSGKFLNQKGGYWEDTFDPMKHLFKDLTKLDFLEVTEKGKSRQLFEVTFRPVFKPFDWKTQSHDKGRKKRV